MYGTLVESSVLLHSNLFIAKFHKNKRTNDVKKHLMQQHKSDSVSSLHCVAFLVHTHDRALCLLWMTELNNVYYKQ